MFINISSAIRLFQIAACFYAPLLIADESLMVESKTVCQQSADGCLSSQSTLTAAESNENKTVIESVETPGSKSATSIESPLIDTKALFSLLDEPQKYVSSGVNSFTKGVDEFFSDEKVLYETSGSYIRLTGDTVLSEGGDFGFVGDVRLKIALPNTQHKLKLVFETDPNEGREDFERQLEDNPVDAAQDKSYFAGLEAIWGEFRHWRVRPGIGLKLNSGLDYFLRVRANRLYAISEKWHAYLSDTLYWFDSSGYGFDASLEFDRKIDGNFLFRSTTFGGWTEQNDYWDLSQVFSLTQSLSDKRALIYQAGVYGVSEPTVFATDYLLQLRYRKQLHSNYLFLELIPKILYQREYDFQAEHSFTVRLEMIFKG